MTLALLAVAALAPPAMAKLEMTAQTIGRPGNGDGALTDPGGVAFDPAGGVWVADTANGRIQRFTRTDAWDRTITGFVAPAAVAVAADGAIYVTDSAAGQLIRLNSDGTRDTSFSAVGWVDPVAVAVDSTSDFLYVVERAPGRVRRVNARTGAIQDDLYTGLQEPSAVAVDASGATAVVEAGTNRVHVRDATGDQLPSFPIGGLATVSRPRGIAFDAFGMIVVATGDRTIHRYTLSGAQGDVLTGFGSPAGIASDGALGFAVADTERDQVLLAEDVLPPPKLGETVNAAPVFGPVSVREGNGPFRPLLIPTQVRVGAEFDTKGVGIARIEAARPDGKTQPVKVSRGRFVIRQPASGIAEALLSEPIGTCPPVRRQRSRARAGALARAAGLPRIEAPPKGAKRKRVLRTKLKGEFKTIGKHATGVVQGTEYEVIDYCEGTLVRVFDGVVRVRARAGRDFRDVGPGPSGPTESLFVRRRSR